MRVPLGGFVALLLAAVLAAAAGCSAGDASASSAREADDRLQAAVGRLVTGSNGPPGAIVVVDRGTDRDVYRAGFADVDRATSPDPDLFMRIASTAKAYSGGVALALVDDGVLALDDTIGERLPWAPQAWSDVTLAQALHHTSGLPDYSADPEFLEHLISNLEQPLPPRRLLGFVADEDLRFAPGTAYRYSNSDNVVVGLMAQAATGQRYARLLADVVLEPLRLERTSLPRGVRMPTPFLHGYARGDDGTPTDVSEVIAAGYAWASGGIVSTPSDQNRFIRGYLDQTLFGRDLQRAQFDWRPGARSEPPGPGENAAGLALFRYRTRCGTVFGHTGNTPGYTQFVAATSNGRRSVVVAVNRQATPEAAPAVFRDLRVVFRLAVCAALAAG